MNIIKKDLGYRTDQISFSRGTVMGLIDSDGSFHISIRNSGSTPLLRKYGIETTFWQTAANRDVVDSLRHTLGPGGRIQKSRGQEESEGNRQPGLI